MFGVAAILAVEWVISKYTTKIGVTPTHVRLSIWLLRRESVRRDEIYAMHWYGRSFTFVNDAQRVPLSIKGPGWTRGQLLGLSESLGVCVSTITGPGTAWAETHGTGRLCSVPAEFVAHWIARYAASS